MSPLLLAFGACPADAAQAARLSNWIAGRTPATSDEALVTTTPSVTEAERRAIAEPLQRVFSKVHTRVLPREISGPRWRPQNYMFQNVAQTIRFSFTHVAGFYFFEPDCLPLTPDWWESLASEYRGCGKPFMGVMRDTFVRDLAAPKGLRWVGRHLNGSAWYPQDCISVVPGLATDSGEIPWDAQWGTSILAKAHISPQMFVELRKPTWTLADLPEIPPGAKVVHGDKDGSLMALYAAPKPAPKKVVAPRPTPVAPPPPTEPPPKAVKRRARRRPGWVPPS